MVASSTHKPRGFGSGNLRSRGGDGASTAQQLPPVCPAGTEVIEHVRSSGGYVHPALVVTQSAPGMGRSVHVTHSVPAGEPLAYVPLSTCVTSRTLLPTSADTREASNDLARVLVTPGAVHKVHMRVLPTREQASCFPLLWPDEAVAALQHAGVESSIRDELAFTAKQHDAAASDLPTWLWARAMADSRAYRRWDGRLSLEPLVDLVNHAPFTLPGSKQRRRNCLHSYVQPGEQAHAARLRHFDPSLAAVGAAVLMAIRPLSRGDEVLVSYRDATAGGDITATDSLLRYGFVRPLSDDAAWLCHELSPDDMSTAQRRLADHVDAAARVGTPKDALLQAALALHARQITTEASELLRHAEQHAAGSPMRMALHFRCARVLSMGRSALRRLPREELAGGGIAAGVRAAGCPQLADQALAALMEPAPRLLTMNEDLVML